MEYAKGNPARFAGLLGGALLVAPQQAYALAVDTGITSGVHSPLAHFIFGFIVGTSCSAAAFALYKHHSALHLQIDVLQDDASDISEETTAVLCAPSQTQKTSVQDENQALDQALDQVLDVDAQKRAALRQRLLALPRIEDEPCTSIATPTCNTAPSRNAEPTRNAVSSEQKSSSLADETKSEVDPQHLARDYEDIAENYVRRENLRKRMAERARGVAEVLSERLGMTDRFSDLPIIQRADGSVGDVGTGWWEAKVGDAVRRVGEGVDFAEDDSQDLAIPSWMDSSATAQTHSTAHAQSGAQVKPSARPAVQRPLNRESRADIIAKSVAQVDQGTFPERRSASELDNEDLWEVALAAMGEKLDNMNPAPLFAASNEDEMHVVDTDVFDRATDFIPFRTPAGHPEVVDSKSYVDYLIDDEFSRNESQTARRQSREYLRVVRGGSQALKATAVRRLAKTTPLGLRSQRAQHMTSKKTSTGRIVVSHMTTGIQEA